MRADALVSWKTFRVADDERHADQGIMQAISMAHQVMVPDIFAVVAGDNQQRPVQDTPLLQVVNQVANFFVDRSQSPIITCA